MATSSAMSTSNEYIKYKITVTQNSQSVADNTSNVTVSVRFYRTNTGYTTYGSGTVYCKINGTTYSASVDSDDKITSSGIVLFTKTLNITHNTNGTKTLTTSAWIDHSRVTSNEQSYSQVLTTIPRASSISCTSANVGSAATITISKANSGFTHTITYSFGSLSGTIVTKTSSTSYSWTIPTTFYAQMAAVKSKTGTLTCTTYNGSTSVGTSTCTFTVTVSLSNAPTMNPRVYTTTSSDTYKLTGNANKLIRYYTWPSYEFNATAQNSATISSYKVTCGDVSATSASGQLQGAITTANVDFAVTDSRGFVTAKTVKADIVDYVKLTCSLQANISPDGVLTVTINGQYFNGSFGKVTNELQVGYKYKQGDGSYSSWIYVTPTISSNSYSVTTTKTGLDYTQSVSVQAWAGDALYSYNLNSGVYTDPVTVKSFPVFDWGENDFNFNVPVKFSSTTNLFPVGSVYHTSTNTNPSSYLGGTWSLINKFLHPTRSSDTAAFFTHNTSAVSSLGSSVMIKQSNSIRIRLNLVLAVDLSDTSITLGTLNLGYLGFSGLAYTQYVVATSDGGNGVVQCSIANDTGIITSLDVVTKTSGGSIASGQTLILDFTLIPPQDYLLDDKCDDFAWRRTA